MSSQKHRQGLLPPSGREIAVLAGLMAGPHTALSQNGLILCLMHSRQDWREQSISALFTHYQRHVTMTTWTLSFYVQKDSWQVTLVSQWWHTWTGAKKNRCKLLICFKETHLNKVLSKETIRQAFLWFSRKAKVSSDCCSIYTTHKNQITVDLKNNVNTRVQKGHQSSGIPKQTRENKPQCLWLKTGHLGSRRKA